MAAAIAAQDTQLMTNLDLPLLQYQGPLATGLDTVAATLTPVSPVQKPAPALHLEQSAGIRGMALEKGHITVNFGGGGHAYYGAVKPGLTANMVNCSLGVTVKGAATQHLHGIYALALSFGSSNGGGHIFAAAVVDAYSLHIIEGVNDIDFRIVGGSQHTGHAVGGYTNSPDYPFPGQLPASQGFLCPGRVAACSCRA